MIIECKSFCHKIGAKMLQPVFLLNLGRNNQKLTNKFALPKVGEDDTEKDCRGRRPLIAQSSRRRLCRVEGVFAVRLEQSLNTCFWEKFRPLLLRVPPLSFAFRVAPIFAQQSQIMIHLRRQTEDFLLCTN